MIIANKGMVKHLICAPAQLEKKERAAQVPHGRPTQKQQNARRLSFICWCGSTIFCRDLDSAGDASFRALSHRKLKGTHVAGGARFGLQAAAQLLAGTTLMDPWRIINHCFASLGAQRSRSNQAICRRGARRQGPTAASRQTLATECWRG